MKILFEKENLRSYGKNDNFWFRHVELVFWRGFWSIQLEMINRLGKRQQNTLFLKHHSWFFPSLTSTSNLETRPCWFCFQITSISAIFPLFSSASTLIQTTTSSSSSVHEDTNSIYLMGLLWDLQIVYAKHLECYLACRGRRDQKVERGPR